MKKTKTFLALALAGTLVCGMAGCNTTKSIANDENTVEIAVYNAGYGVAWLDAMIEKFEAATDYDVEYKEIGDSSVVTEVRSGESTVDLYISGTVWQPYLDLGSKAVSGYNYLLEPLDDVYAYVPEGETKSIGDKMWKDYKEYYAYEAYENGEYVSHQYAMPWTSGFSGLFYNKTVFDQVGLTSEPRTTDELYEYCLTIKDKTDVDPLIYSTSSYWQYMFNTWWVQYESLQGYENFFNGVEKESDYPDAVKSLKIFDQQGIYSSLYVIQELLNYDNHLANELVNSYDFMTAQARFIKGEGAIIPCGDWIENEMKMAGTKVNSEILPMQNPINSAISDKLSYWNKNISYMTAIESGMTSSERAVYDAKLRELIDYVDGVTTEKPSWASDTDVSIVRAARRVCYSTGATCSAAIPVYANAKVAAKEFLKYMGTNEACALYQQNTNGSLMPYDYDATAVEGYNNLSNFAKRKIEMMQNVDWALFYANKPLQYNGSVSPVRITSTYEIVFGSKDTSARKTAKQLVEETKTYWSNNDRMSQALIKAHLI